MAERGAFHAMAQAANQARREGYHSLSHPVVPPDVHSAAEFFAAYFGDKDGRFTIFADIIDRVCERSLQAIPTRGPWGLIVQTTDEPVINGTPRPAHEYSVVSHFAHPDPFLFLQRALNSTLLVDATRELAHLDRQQTENPASREAELYRQWLAWEHPQRQYVNGSLSLVLTVDEGIHTGNRTFVGIPQAVPSVFERQFHLLPTVAETMAIAHHTYPLTVDLASGSTARLRFTEGKVADNTFTFFDPNTLTIVGENHQRLDVLPDIRTRVEAELAELADMMPENTVGCPAMVNFGSGSAIQRLYHRTLQIIEANASIFYPQLSE